MAKDDCLDAIDLKDKSYNDALLMKRVKKTL